MRDPAVRCELVAALADAAGAAGMVGGQMIDLIAEQRPLDIGAITRLQRMKTGALIAFSCEAGAILGKAPNEPRQALAPMRTISGSPSRSPTICSTSKAPRRRPASRSAPMQRPARPLSCRSSASTRARAQAELLARQAAAHLDLFDERADLLREAAQFVITRRT